MQDYNNYSVFDTVLTGDGIDRTSAYVEGSLESVEPYVYTKHQVLLTTRPYFYMRFRTDMINHDVTTSTRNGGSRYPGGTDNVQYGPGNKLGFELSYKGVFCGGITRLFASTGSLGDGSSDHDYLGGQYCLFWIKAPPTPRVWISNYSAPDCNNTNGTLNSSNFSNCTDSAANPAANGSVTNWPTGYWGAAIVGQVVELTINRASIHNSDMLRILDGKTTSANVIQAYHNTTTHPSGRGSALKVTTAASLDDGLLVEFATDQENHGEGFDISWTVVDVNPGELCSGVKQLTAHYGTFRDHSGSFHSYRTAMDCHWEITLVSYVQQIEFFVEELALHPGKTSPFFNSQGLGQQRVIRLGQSHHPFSDFIALFNGHRNPVGAWENERLVANHTGYFAQPSHVLHSHPVAQPLSIQFNGSNAGAWFHSTAAYVGEGFMVRYQAVYSDSQAVEMWGDGLTHAKVGKAALITLRTSRKLYPGMKDVRTGTILDSSTVSSAAKDYMTQGGAEIRIRLWTGQFDASGSEIFTAGENLDLDTGYYYLSYQTQKVGRFRMTVEMLTYPTGQPYGTPVYRQVNGSPFQIDVAVGAVHVLGSSVTGDGLAAASPGVQGTFVIQAGDINGNMIYHGGHRFVAKLDGPAAVAAVIKDNNDGTYAGSYTITKSGTYLLFIGLAYGISYEVAVSGSPYTFDVTPISCPADCSGKGVCSDTGVCKCDAQFEGLDCSTDFLDFYQKFLTYENAVLGTLVFFSFCYYAFIAVREAKVGPRNNDLDDDSDEEEEFLGLACCMHW